MNKNTTFSIYRKLPENHREYFEQHLIPIGQPTYPEVMLKALRSLNDAIAELKAKGAGISEGKNLSTGKNPAFWQFLRKVPLSQSGSIFLESHGCPNDLADFCSNECKGILNIAIDGVDRLTRLSLKQEETVPDYEFLIYSLICELIERNEFEWTSAINDFPLEDDVENQKLINSLISRKLLEGPLTEYLSAKNSRAITEELQETGSFIRDVAALIVRNRGNDRRSHERQKDLQDQKPLRAIKELNLFSETEAARVLTKILYSGASSEKIQRILKPLYPVRKNSPLHVLAGFCIMCHRPSDADEYYCVAHTKPSKNFEEDLKKDRNKTVKKRIHSAFENLGYLLAHEQAAIKKYPRIFKKYELLKGEPAEIRKNIYKNYKHAVDGYLQRLKLTDKKILIAKVHFLHAWGIHHPSHQLFYNDLREIEKKYMISDNCWSTSSLRLINDILLMSKRHTHTKDLFPANIGLLQCDTKELGLILNIQNLMLDGDIQEQLSPLQFSESINRYSIFKLIEIAASKRKFCTVVNENYRSNDRIKSSI